MNFKMCRHIGAIAALAVVTVCEAQIDSNRPHKVGLFDPTDATFNVEDAGTFRFIRPGPEAALFPLSGDWDGDGVDSIGLWDRDRSEFHLKNYENGYWAPGDPPSARTYYADEVFQYGPWESDSIPLAGDWDGDGVDSGGLYFPSTFEFHLKNTFEGGDGDIVTRLPVSGVGEVPIVGDWDGDGVDTPGYFNPYRSRFQLWNTFGGQPDETFYFGPQFAYWTPIVGDWDGDGIDSIGLHEDADGRFHLKNTFAGGDGDEYFQFGPALAGWTPIAGDWDGDGVATIGLHNTMRSNLEEAYDPVRSEFHLKNSFSGGDADHRFGFGWHNDFQPIVGSWEGTYADGVGVYDPATSLWHITSRYTSIDLTFHFGAPRSGWIAVAGDWDGDGIDTIGLYDPVESMFHLKNSFSGGDSDIYRQFGIPGSEFWPIVGDWDNDGTDTVGLYWREQSMFFLVNDHTSAGADEVFTFGDPLVSVGGAIQNWPGSFPIVGNWGRYGADLVGLYDPATSIFSILRELDGTNDPDELILFDPITDSPLGAGDGRRPISGLIFRN